MVKSFFSSTENYLVDFSSAAAPSAQRRQVLNAALANSAVGVAAPRLCRADIGRSVHCADLSTNVCADVNAQYGTVDSAHKDANDSLSNKRSHRGTDECTDQRANLCANVYAQHGAVNSANEDANDNGSNIHSYCRTDNGAVNGADDCSNEYAQHGANLDTNDSSADLGTNVCANVCADLHADFLADRRTLRGTHRVAH